MNPESISGELIEQRKHTFVLFNIYLSCLSVKSAGTFFFNYSFSVISTAHISFSDVIIYDSSCFANSSRKIYMYEAIFDNKGFGVHDLKVKFMLYSHKKLLSTASCIQFNIWLWGQMTENNYFLVRYFF